MRWNSWTKAYNYLLVEKLVTKSEEESWKEMAIMVGSSATFETESMKCQAARKYAAYYKVPLESVKMEEITNSPRGVRGWCELNVVVPGVNDKEKDSEPAPKAVPKKGSRKAAAVEDQGQPAEEDAGGDGGTGSRRSSAGGTGGRAKKTKKEQSATQQAESQAKSMLAQLQRSQQIMSKISGHGDEIPSEWRWASPFLQEYRELLQSFEDAMNPAEGDHLQEFVDDLKLTSIDKRNSKQFRNVYKDRYGTLLTLFVDRCSGITAQKLVLAH